MKEARRWLIHRNKVPHYASRVPRNGRLDSPEDVANLVSYGEAQAALHGLREWGLGFALGPDGSGNYWQGIDLDHIDENGLADLANTLPGYVEFSPSGLGAHAIGYGARFDALPSDGSGTEAYCEGRFFTFTGNKIGGST